MIRAAQQGDLEAFNQLVLNYENLLFRIALNILNDEDAAADATQEAFLSAFRSLGLFRGGSLRGWLTRIAVNACYDQLRYLRRRPTQPLEQVDDFGDVMDSALRLADPARLPLEQVEQRELEHAIHQCLERLAPKYRTVTILVDVQGLSYEEAAAVLRVPVGTIKSRLARARLALRSALAAYQDLFPYRVNIVKPIRLPELV